MRALGTHGCRRSVRRAVGNRRGRGWLGTGRVSLRKAPSALLALAIDRRAYLVTGDQDLLVLSNGLPNPHPRPVRDEAPRIPLNNRPRQRRETDDAAREAITRRAQGLAVRVSPKLKPASTAV